MQRRPNQPVHAVLVEKPFLRRGYGGYRYRSLRATPGAYRNPGKRQQPGHVLAACGTVRKEDIREAEATRAFRQVTCPSCLVRLDHAIEAGAVEIREGRNGVALIMVVGKVPAFEDMAFGRRDEVCP